MSLIRDIMQKNVLTVGPKTMLADAARLLSEHRLEGAPVVDTAGAVVGDISEPELIDIVFDEQARRAPVSLYMTKHIRAVTPDDSLASVAQLFALSSYNRIPVVEGGQLVGVITRRDLINHSLCANETLREPLVELIPALAPWS